MKILFLLLLLTLGCKTQKAREDFKREAEQACSVEPNRDKQALCIIGYYICYNHNAEEFHSKACKDLRTK